VCIVKFDNWYYTSTSTALPCNVAGYTGSINYTCTTGTLSVTGSCSCSTGYSLVSGVCTRITCSITSVSKLNNKTGLAYVSSATAIPNTPTSAYASGYTASATYTCTTTGAATIVSNSCSGLNSTGALNACQSSYGDCYYRTGDCAGEAYCGGGGIYCYGWTSDCSGGAGRIWPYGNSYTTYGYWY